ncbi:MAG TPA: hypothetical protein VFP90_04135 [Gemmatimonadaceae bacterium]|nr:hypothetical protein [Gemmatimonadaceae bacterium]
MRVLLASAAVLMFAAGVVLGYVAAVAVRRGEGVFMPAGYAALLCLAGGGFLARLALR